MPLLSIDQAVRAALLTLCMTIANLDVTAGVSAYGHAFVPHPHLTIGVTGHRLARLGPENISAVRAVVDSVLARIADAAAVLPAPPKLRVLTALADGGDTVVAEAARARGWALMSVLPFPRDRYSADFTSSACLATYNALLDVSTTVFELPDHDAAGDAPRGYEAAGRVVLGQCDILVAIWDHGPVLGRGGAGQMVAEAVLLDIPVIQIDPKGATPPTLLWDGLTAHDLGQQTVETVPKATLDALPSLLQALFALPDDAADRALLRQFAERQPPRWHLAIGYPLLLALVGVRRLRRADFRSANPQVAGSIVMRSCSRIIAQTGAFGGRLRTLLVPRFAHADVMSSAMAQVFRSSYVANFALSACAVLLTLLSLALPISAKPLLLLAELFTIGTVLALTTAGNLRGWHGRWLDNRHLAECLRCLAVSAQIGVLNVQRSGSASGVGWVNHYVRATAREMGLPNVVVDATYLSDVRAGLCDLIDAQIAYLHMDAQRMHRLEHRLHLLGTALFAVTALVCIGSLAFEGMMRLWGAELSAEAMHLFIVGVTMLTAGLPALGAAIYGIRMQGEFAAVAERAYALSDQLTTLREIIDKDDLSFDTLKRRIVHTTDLLTTDLSQWHQTYRARPLSLPG